MFAPPKPVDNLYVMDPKTEELLFDGRDLCDGMVILIANDEFRFPDLSVRSDRDREALNKLMYNRWVEVSRLNILPKYENPNSIAFIGIYKEGTKRKIVVPISEPWYVKLDSIPENYEMFVSNREHVNSVKEVSDQISFIPLNKRSFDPVTDKYEEGEDGLSTIFTRARTENLITDAEHHIAISDDSLCKSISKSSPTESHMLLSSYFELKD